MNKIKIAIGSIFGAIGLAVASSVGAVANYIELPVGFIDDCLAYVGGIFSDLKVVIILVIGLPLGFWVIRKVISLVRAR